MTSLANSKYLCSKHGRPTKRERCRECNAAYMRNYLQKRRSSEPEKELWKRARDRARRRKLAFNLEPQDIFIPAQCPVLSIPLVVGKGRRPGSPSLDRVEPYLGYTLGNVRVISDQANRLKSDHSLESLAPLMTVGSNSERARYEKVAQYMKREAELRKIRIEAERARAISEALANVATMLDAMFARGEIPQGFSPSPMS